MHLNAQVIRPGDPGYAEASVVYVGEGKPAVIVRPLNAAEVAEAVVHAVQQDLVLSVRSGGHSGMGFGTNDDGVVIDLSLINDVTVIDEASRRVRIGAGAKWGDVADSLAKVGLSLTSGDTRSVGVGGLTQGGGVGWMVRNHGLTIDSMLAAEVVTADGQQLRVDEASHPELFWAIRGGGGNFGIVTHFEFTAQRVTDVHAGTIMYAVDDVPRLIKGWSKALREAPEELNATLVLMPAFGPDLPAGAMGLVCYAEPDGDAAEAAFAPLREVATVINVAIEAKPYKDVLEEAHPPPGLRATVTNTMVATVTDELADFVAGFYAEGTAGRLVFIRALGGAMSRIPDDATAWAHRNVEAMVLGATFLPEPTTTEALAEALSPFDPVHEFGVGSYSGFLTTASDTDLARMYPPQTLQRLVEVKRVYDPQNLFNQNFNIRP
jgi:FAD/FMN-containing dehydrogenase